MAYIKLASNQRRGCYSGLWSNRLLLLFQSGTDWVGCPFYSGSKCTKRPQWNGRWSITGPEYVFVARPWNPGSGSLKVLESCTELSCGFPAVGVLKYNVEPLGRSVYISSRSVKTKQRIPRHFFVLCDLGIHIYYDYASRCCSRNDLQSAVGTGACKQPTKRFGDPPTTYDHGESESKWRKIPKNTTSNF